MTALKLILGKPLISLTDGKKVGEVKDLYFDEKLEKIVGVSLGSEGLINKKYFAVDRANVTVMGIDAWLVTSSDVSVAAEMLPEADRLTLYSVVRGREISTEGGTKIGAVDDVLIDGDGNILGFTMTKIVVQGPLAERKTIARSVISTVGGTTSAMTTDLGKAETTPIPTA
jgi:sporulation protein YlmC with PRC-barrel domain